MSLIDSHCHLDFPDFASEITDVLARARAAGVERLITISTQVDRFSTYRALAEAHDPVFFTIGTHPNHVLDEPEASLATLIDLAKHPKCVGIGEAGLDYHYDRAPRDLAARVFKTHIAAARATGLPLVIHARNADDDMANVLRVEMGQGAFRAVLHCFTSSAALAQAGLELGLYVSFSGVLTFKASHDLRAIAQSVPLDRLLVETDAPFLAPVPHRGKRNEPAFVAATAAALALAKGITLSEISAWTMTNTLTLFDKIPLFEKK